MKLYKCYVTFEIRSVDERELEAVDAREMAVAWGTVVDVQTEFQEEIDDEA